MINLATLSFLAFLISSFYMVAIYYNLFILSPVMYLLTGIVIGVIYMFNRRTSDLNRKADKMMILSTTLYIVSMLSAFIYKHWKLTNVISEINITKIMVVLLGFMSLYLNFVYIRAEQSYKKKRGNQRIKQEVKQGYIEELVSGFKKQEEQQKEIYFKIGEWAENDDNRN